MDLVLAVRRDDVVEEAVEAERVGLKLFRTLHITELELVKAFGLTLQATSLRMKSRSFSSLITTRSSFCFFFTCCDKFVVKEEAFAVSLDDGVVADVERFEEVAVVMVEGLST